MSFANYPADTLWDEAAIPPYALPPLFGAQTEPDADWWRSERRPALLALFEKHVFGLMPGEPTGHALDEMDGGSPLAAGRRQRLRLTLQGRGAAVAIDIALYQPAEPAPGRPLVVVPNFFGNASVDGSLPDALPAGWVRFHEQGAPRNAALPLLRGLHQDRMPVDMLLGRGIAVATFYDGDICVDEPLQARERLAGLAQAFPRGDGRAMTGGAIAAWAWGMQHVSEALAGLPAHAGAFRVAAGHSRQGKAALWAAASAPAHFAMAIGNNAGAGGASLARRIVGERVHHLTTRFPHWFTAAYAAFNHREADMPVDQHMLLALLAPRPLSIGSAAGDHWADPVGERLAVQAAAPAFALLGQPGWPRHHLREGRHELLPEDWRHYAEAILAAAAQ